MEVVRDKADNCIIVCSIENVDPMGVHTGDSITVAPALTLTDKEYQIMRNAALRCCAIGVETGGSNVQFAVNPADGRLVIIEMNPRVCAPRRWRRRRRDPDRQGGGQAGGRLHADELENDITGGATPASFEPTIDYVVTGSSLRVREVSRRRAHADHVDEIGRRGWQIGRTFAKACKRRCGGWNQA
jgi:carbamoyl-phosphate synthase large subunit